MRVGVLIIAHDELGSVLLDIALGAIGAPPLRVQAVSVTRGADPDELLERANELAADLDGGAGVLVLTDMYGSTPGNIACRLQQLRNVRVVAGLNLPMLIRVFNYPDLDLEAMAEKAVSGGNTGVLHCGLPEMEDNDDQ
jgi:PTS system ascorbate-specific IIA component